MKYSFENEKEQYLVVDEKGEYNFGNRKDRVILNTIDDIAVIERIKESYPDISLIREPDFTVSEKFSAEKAADIRRRIEVEPEDEASCMGEDETITYTVTFADGFQADIKICGVQFEEGGCNCAWTEGILFDDKGRQVECTEPSDAFFGEWDFEDDETDTMYRVIFYE